MASPIIINPATQGRQIWSARKAPDINSLLLMNTDLNNTVLVGSDLTSLVVPILPNGSLSVDPSENWYAVWSVAGGSPLVILPNGQSNFLGLTQGLGSLVLPSVHSPNFLAGISGWTINKDGSAEFNNLTIRGTFKGTNFVIDSTGEYVYSPSPGANNLVETIGLTAAGTDAYGNTTLPGHVNYLNQAGTYYALQIQGGSGLLPLIRWLKSSGNQSGVYSTLYIIGYITSAGLTGIDLGSAASFANPPICWSNPLIAQDPVTPANGAETWHALTLLNGWALTSSNLAHFTLSNDNKIEFVGALNGGAATGVNIASLGTAYHPATAQQWAVGCTAGVIAGQSAFLNLSPGGTLFVSGITPGTVGQSITLNGRVSRGAPSSP